MNPEALQRVRDEMPGPPVVADGAGLWERWQAFTIRRRTLFSLLVVVPLVGLARAAPTWYLVGSALMVLGIALRVVASGYLIKSAQLTVTGPFAHMRHPLYLANFVIAMGYCAMSGRWSTFPVVAALFVAVYAPTIAFEESFLADKFGDTYVQYRARVPSLFPRWRAAPGSWAGFRWSLVLFNKEHVNVSGLVALAAAFAVRLLL
jgi:protein-S-isoprenylcysteine O-methyltransferase Ste14